MAIFRALVYSHNSKLFSTCSAQNTNYSIYMHEKISYKYSGQLHTRTRLHHHANKTCVREKQSHGFLSQLYSSRCCCCCITFHQVWSAYAVFFFPYILSTIYLFKYQFKWHLIYCIFSNMQSCTRS